MRHRDPQYLYGNKQDCFNAVMDTWTEVEKLRIDKALPEGPNTIANAIITMTMKIYFDGLCEPVNPMGVAVYAFIAFNEKQEEIYHDVDLACKPFTTNATNNFAEYTALIKALDWAVDNNIKRPFIFGDSKLIVNQTNGEWKVKKQRLHRLYLIAQHSKTQCNAELTWIEREQNHADRLTQDYYKEYARKNGIKGETISEWYSEIPKERDSRLL